MDFKRIEFKTMSSPDEIIISSDASGQLWNSCLWDLQSGTSLLTFKGGTSAPRTLDLINKEYLIAASNTKPVLHIWPLQKKESNQMKIVCPGIVTSLTVTPDGSYCIAGIAEKIHMWQVCTGSLLAVLSRHYQTVRCLQCTDDGSTFVSGGDDNLVIVWSLGVILAECGNFNTVTKPRHVWSSHSLPVTDIHVGIGGSRARVVSSSLDQTCRLWDISSGELLCKFVFDVSIMTVTMDAAEFQLFAGGSNGVIYSVNLFEMPIRNERHFQDSTENTSSVKFQGHTKKVSCLSLSFDGTQLVSGSHDNTVKVWDVYSGQCIKTLSHKEGFVYVEKLSVMLILYERKTRSFEELMLYSSMRGRLGVLKN
ncbi:hypothetical protein KUTeg_016263 [Tegillarca granosa]|uniref:WD repeat-containing protein 18 n=1 Tax=Tegillarca granosa TaxID=220873 RepID=A0ABQ9EKC8_TEGGR|nr:hypothetical protein KUTeg_016263 [Tegillarca granosa]